MAAPTSAKPRNTTFPVILAVNIWPRDKGDTGIRRCGPALRGRPSVSFGIGGHAYGSTCPIFRACTMNLSGALPT